MALDGLLVSPSVTRLTTPVIDLSLRSAGNEVDRTNTYGPVDMSNTSRSRLTTGMKISMGSVRKMPLRALPTRRIVDSMVFSDRSSTMNHCMPWTFDTSPYSRIMCTNTGIRLVIRYNRLVVIDENQVIRRLEE